MLNSVTLISDGVGYYEPPPMHIYHSELWDSNYVARFYDICESFLDRVYFLICNKEAPAFSPEAKPLVATMGDWYVGESFTYIRVYGSNATHMLHKVVPDRLVLEEISFQIVTEGIYKKCVAPKRKFWPRFPITLCQNPKIFRKFKKF